jgi:hypothetical protein
MALSRPLESLDEGDAFKTGHGFSIYEKSKPRMVLVERPSTSPAEREALRLNSYGSQNAAVRAGKVEHILENNGYQIVARAGQGEESKRFISFVKKDGHLFCIRHAALIDYPDRSLTFASWMTRLVTRDEFLGHREGLGAFDKAVEDGQLSHMLAGVQVNKEDGSIERVVIARLK